MSRSAARARTGQDRTSLYSEITDKIIAELEAGRVPWVQPWGTAAAKASLAMPKNAATERRYSGVNVLILWGAVIERGFTGQSWLTFRQALSLGANVRKGEHGTTVVYADRFIPDDERKRAARDRRRARSDPVPQTLHGVQRRSVRGSSRRTIAPPPAPLAENLILPQAEALIRATGADIRIGGDRAFYVPSAGLRPGAAASALISSRSIGTGRLAMSSVIMPRSGLCRMASAGGQIARHRPCGCSA